VLGSARFRPRCSSFAHGDIDSVSSGLPRVVRRDSARDVGQGCPICLDPQRRRPYDREICDRDQLDALDGLHRRLETERVEYWLFGGWAVDFHVGAVTRSHSDLDLAIWVDDVDRVATLLGGDGWVHVPDETQPGSIAFARGTVRVELAFLQRDDAGGEPYTPIGDGRRATWAAGAFGQDIRTLAGVRARVITLRALREEKTGSRDHPVAEAKDRQDLATLERLA